MALKNYGLFRAIAVVLIVYWLYEPLYPGMDDIWHLRFIIAGNKVIAAIGTVTGSLGFTSGINLTRIISRSIIPKHQTSDSVEVFDDNFSGVSVRIFRPVRKDKSSSEELPGLMYFHGGGWVIMDVDMYHSLTLKIANETGFVVVSVEYRRAPENPFPIPFDDCLTATIHLLRNGKDYGVDVNQIAISGDSAGGNLAAAVALRLRVETNLPALKAQVLIYPAVQAFDLRTPSMLTRQLPGYLSQGIMIKFWLLYYQGNIANFEQFLVNNHTSALLKASEYGDAVAHSLLPEEFQKELLEKPKKNFGNDKLSEAFEPTLLNPYFNPLLAEHLDNLPPTLMITAEYDVLRDDGFLYVKKLEVAGVPVEHKHFKNAFHGFVSVHDTKGQKEFLAILGKFLHKNI